MRAFDLRLPTPLGPPAARERPDAPGESAAPARDGLRIDVPERLYVPRALQTTGLAGYEPETLACFLALIERHGGPVFDVGANVGIFSLLAAALGGAQVVAFEPTPDLAEVARGLALENGLEVTVEDVALGAADGTAVFHLSDLTDSSNSLLDGFRPSSTSIEVAVETMETYCRRTSCIPRVLKIDTEATEPDVLRGARSVVAEHRPWIICEVLAKRTEPALEELLPALGYTWYQITTDLPFVPRREIFGDRAYTYNNWLFAPEVPDAAFWERVGAWRKALRSCGPPAIVEPDRPAPTPAEVTSEAARASAQKPQAPPPRRRRRGVYGRKQLLAGVVGGALTGASAVWAARGWRHSDASSSGGSSSGR